MAISAIWKLCAVKIGTTIIGQITEQQVAANITEALPDDSGNIYNRAAAIEKEDNRITFTTQAIKTALGVCGLTGLNLSGNTCVCYFKQIEQGANIKAAGCVTFTAAAGIMLWRGLSAPESGLATASFEIIPVSANGTAAPLVRAADVALPTCITEEMYVAGGAGIKNFNIDSGIQEVADSDASDDYLTLAALEKILPTVTVSKIAMGELGTGTLASVAITNLESGGRRGSAPITFAFNEVLVATQSVGELTEYKGTLVYDGTNAPIVITGL